MTQDLKDVRVAMVHHHPIAHEKLDLGAEDLLLNGDQLVELLEEHKFGVIIHGHKHHPRIRYAPGRTVPPVVFASGSFSAMSPFILSNTRNLFHIMDLYDKVPRCGVAGHIRSWEYNFTRGWSPPVARSADIPAVTSFGCREKPTDLAKEVAQIINEVGKPVVDWSQITDTLPCVDFLLPGDLTELGTALRDESGVELWPRPPERPEQVVRGASS